MPRRIRNITEEPLFVPSLGVTVQPGDVANVPDSHDYAFSENYWEVDGSRDESNDNASGEIRDVTASDDASTEEGNN